MGSNPTPGIVRHAAYYANMRSHEERAAALALVEAGVPKAEVSRRLGIPRPTIVSWVHRPGPWTGGTPTRPTSRCESCGVAGDLLSTLPQREYAYLLGMYLGDGSIVAAKRGVFRLRITLDTAYPGIINECAAAIREVIPGRKVGLVPHRDANCLDVSAYCRHMPCLFPQHGPGLKHTRRILLEPWQMWIVSWEPEALLRGLIHSDGCRVMNRATMPKKTYFYPRYQFSNRSQDIHAIFRDACERVGVEWRASGPYTTNVSRRRSVEELDRFIGPKS